MYKIFVSILFVIFQVAQSAEAAVFGSLTFRDPTGTVSTTAPIEVWVTLTIDPTSDPLTYIKGASFPNGVNTADLPTEGGNFIKKPFASYTGAFIFAGLNCSSSTFIAPPFCSGHGAQYDLDHNPWDSRGWYAFTGTMNPGESRDFLWGTWLPADGSANEGTYELSAAFIGLGVSGLDSSGSTIYADIYKFAVANCGEASCKFTRTVSAVPIPASIWLFGSTLIGMIGLRRRAIARPNM